MNVFYHSSYRHIVKHIQCLLAWTLLQHGHAAASGLVSTCYVGHKSALNLHPFHLQRMNHSGSVQQTHAWSFQDVMRCTRI